MENNTANKGMTEAQMVAGLKLAGVADTTENRAAIVMVTIQALHEAGMAVPAAYDAVMGRGAYSNLSESVWIAAMETTTK